ncbi:DNA mismatch repair protein MutS [Treponema socranskii subsp. socranskii VPI DR56BR1116 = ATCC 35536]|uniref:DNA mismatch repair protein MutS n=1 Tax=Treponema socranskii subsp. socranskii VPI DR56BR1116 = ATCC 35536 TaxID=1125725 RepID=A0ABP2YKQ6_TRESO|nr:DNA mismatch repair protein MutS [Treponema socranskii]ERK01510.1 DNA mismatch repair protein MutS [Treponema socranskii subsp. socranskii VPI DR56BR1116 = ATCC 35536]
MKTENSPTPLMAQYASIKSKYKNEVLFFRLGDFYEMFNKDAIEVSRLLNLTLTHRGPTPMCGIPYHAAKVYIARLLRLGKKIVICEQVGEAAHGKGLTERKVVEIITPGTAVEAEYLDGSVDNYAASLSVSHGKAGFAFIDVTTSSFIATSWPASQMAEHFPKELSRSSPRELLLPESLKSSSVVREALSAFPSLALSYYPDWHFNANTAYKKLTAQFKTANLQSFGLREDSAEVAPAGFLLDYLEKTTNTAVPHVDGIRVYRDSEYVVIDDSSMRNLEVTANLRDGSTQYSLLECVNYTKTAMGNRMLRSWLLYPLTDLKKISARQEHVSLFTDDRKLLGDIRSRLEPILDIERLAGRIAMDRAHPKDLQALRGSLEGWRDARGILQERDFSLVDFSRAECIIEIIKEAINDDPPTTLTEGKIIKNLWSEELDHWRSVHDNFDKILSRYEEEERRNTGIANLKIKYTNAFGYFIEVSKGKLSAVPPHFIMRRALVNGDRYTTEKLQELEHELTESDTKVLELERDLFIEIRNSLHEYVPYLMQLAGEIAYTDASSSFAHAAVLHAWTKPEITDGCAFEVEQGRHPVVEAHMGAGEFVPNDLAIGDDGLPSFALITGPNMAGKSTFLRQNALIALLAQTGSFVPAKKAKLGIVDRIFCRVGATDNLARGESTFLVEMTETANILRSATKKSLVIMDEVGRGTSTEDGLSIAQAVSEYLLDSIGCKTLFATHYHELTRMEHPSLKMLCMDVSEENGTVVFLRKVKEGAAENSYGIHVARLAGVPQSVIDRASVILAHIQNLAANKPVLDSVPDVRSVFETPGLFSDEEIVLDEILSADTDNMTPLAALQAVARWKKSLSGK